MGLMSTVTGTEVVVSGLRNTSNAVMKAAFMGVINALAKAYEYSHDMISLSDHSLADLAKMGHPYGFKHPAIIHDPDEMVHRQTGEYLDALKVSKPSSGADREIVEGNVGIEGNAEMEQLDRFIQLGTSKMRARPWSQYIVDNHGDELAEIVESAVADALAAEAS